MLPFAGLWLSGCQVAHMELPQGLQSRSNEMAVEGRALSVFGGSFQFGPYQVTDVHRGWTKVEGLSGSVGIVDFNDSDAKQKYKLSVNEAGRPAWAVHCANRADWTQLEMGGLLGGRFGVEFSSDQQLACILNQDGREKPSQLVMAKSLSADKTELKGAMMDGATRIDISETHKLESTPLQVGRPTGYIFEIEGRPVGAVEVMNKGTVWLDGALPPETRSALAAASAALLLYQDIKEAHEDAKRV